MAGRLENKIAIVTGGATGIGEAICHKFALEGAGVVVVGLPSDPVDDVVKSITAHGHKAVAFKGDVSEERDAAAAVTTAVDTFGRLDVLVNNAGVFLANALTPDYPIEDFDKTLKNNLRTAFLMTRFALPGAKTWYSKSCLGDIRGTVPLKIWRTKSCHPSSSTFVDQRGADCQKSSTNVVQQGRRCPPRRGGRGGGGG